MFHNNDTFAMSSSWQDIDSLGSYITLPADSVGSGYCLFVGSTAGAAVSLGFRVDFLFENDVVHMMLYSNLLHHWIHRTPQLMHG